MHKTFEEYWQQYCTNQSFHSSHPDFQRMVKEVAENAWNAAKPKWNTDNPPFEDETVLCKCSKYYWVKPLRGDCRVGVFTENEYGNYWEDPYEGFLIDAECWIDLPEYN